MKKKLYRTSDNSVRRKVLGNNYVNSLLTDWEPAIPLLQLLDNYPWGFLWVRDELDLKTRSLITVAILSALGREEELKTHIKGAFRNECTVKELIEVALHSAIYAGVPTGLECTKIIKSISENMNNLDS